MLKLIIGGLIGIVIGVFAMAMVTASSRADDRMETMTRERGDGGT